MTEKPISQQEIQQQWHVFPTANDVADKALALILTVSRECIANKGSFSIVLAGGTTPKNIYELLAKENCDWAKWHLYLGDERCLPENDAERNSQMILTSLVDNIEIPAENLHFIPAELGPDIAAKQYAAVVSKATPFDLVMLGMGEDGHTASLFPGNIHDTTELTHAVHNSPKPPMERVSISASALSKNENLLIIVTGKGKQEAVSQWKNGVNLPVTTIASLKNNIVMLDEAAEVN